MYVIRCVDLYIKDGGFTRFLSQAKHYSTLAAAKRDCVYPWRIVKVKDANR